MRPNFLYALKGGKVMSPKTTVSNKHSKSIFKLLFLVSSTLFTLLLMEGIVRLASGWLPEETQQLLRIDARDYGVSHPYIGHLHKPNGTIVLSGRDFQAAHHTDGYGFRNAWPWPERAEIVILGDSMVFGHGVEDEQAWPAILQRVLPQSRVINLGLSGATPQQYLRVYETFGQKLHPQVLLVGIFVGNDFWDADAFDRWLQSGASVNYIVWRDFGRPRRVSFSLRQPVDSIIGTLRWKSFLFARKSYLFNLLLHVRGEARRWLRAEPKILQLADGNQLQLLPSDFTNKTIGAQPDRREFQLVLEALHRIQLLAKEQNTQVLIVFQPSKEEVYLPLLGETPPDPGGPLRGAFEKLGIAHLDLTPAFRLRAAAGEQLFFEADGHPNAVGYALIAEGVLSYLKANATRYGLQRPGEEFSRLGS
jgi:lysophospholipase L1-like esterase